MLTYVIARKRFMTLWFAFLFSSFFKFYFYQTPIIDGSISSAASFIIIEVEQQIEKMASLQWEWQRSVITSIHNAPC